MSQKFYQKASVQVAIVSAICLIIVTVITILHQRSQLKTDNIDLNKQIRKLETELAQDRDAKAVLHRENLHLKKMIDPVKRKAEILYPELETAAAIAKLAEDLQEVRSLATRDVYRPLSQDRKLRLISGLRSIREHNTEFPLSVTIVVQQGSSARAKVATDLMRYMQDAGVTVKKQSAMVFSSGTLHDLSIKMNPKDIPVAKQFANVIATLFINKQFSGVKKDKFVRGQIEIQICGDPLFTDTGVVTFK